MFASLVIWGGILTLILAIRDPVTVAVISGINFLRYKLNPDVLWIEKPYLTWDLITVFAITGIVYIIAGLALAAWLHPKADKNS